MIKMSNKTYAVRALRVFFQHVFSVIKQQNLTRDSNFKAARTILYTYRNKGGIPAAQELFPFILSESMPC